VLQVSPLHLTTFRVVRTAPFRVSGASQPTFSPRLLSCVPILSTMKVVREAHRLSWRTCCFKFGKECSGHLDR
jgi:hypothetical protein